MNESNNKNKQQFRIALIGNPNCGKTTIFNALCKAHQKVGNYSGVTVERITGVLNISDLEIEVVDLPGIYGMTSGSPEEKIAVSELTENKIDLIVNILDSSNLQRNLFLSSHLFELQIPMLMVFNMADEAKERGINIDNKKFEKFFGVPVVETVGSKESGLNRLRVKIKQALLSNSPQTPNQLNYPEVITAQIHAIENLLTEKEIFSKEDRSRNYFAIKLLEDDKNIINNPRFASVKNEVIEAQKRLSNRYQLEISTLMSDRRYGLIAGACREAISIRKNNSRQISDAIDKVVTNRYLGVPIFLLIMYLVFQFTISLAAYPVEKLEEFFGFLGSYISSIYPLAWSEFFRDLIVDGIIGGVGGVLVFLPNIVMLFLAITFLEETGYMARAAFIMDGFMHKFGLHGKSFIPMLLGFGCTVPAIMATRTIESKKDRLTTIMILPLMSCSARLPIYALIIPIFFREQYQVLVLWSLYVIGVIVALIGAKILKKTMFSGEDELFIMELPPYRMVKFSGLLIQMWSRIVMYLKKAATIILLASVIMFVLNVYPEKKVFDFNYEQAIVEVQKQSNLSQEEKELALMELDNQKVAELMEFSLAGRLGKAITNVTKYIGFDWKVSTSLVGAFAGKELFVSQMGILYSAGATNETNNPTLRAQLRAAYTPLQAFSIMLFCLLSIPCVATIAVVKKETNSWGLTFFQFFGLLLVAYVICFAVYNIGLLFN